MLTLLQLSKNTFNFKSPPTLLVFIIIMTSFGLVEAQKTNDPSKAIEESNVKEEIELPDIVKLPNTDKGGSQTEELLFSVVEKMPCFPGCTESTSEKNRACAQRKMLEFIYSNTEYPKLARENGVEGTVVVRFVVSKTGELLDIECVRDIGAGCGKEAVRVVELMPKWEPGYQRGVPVKVQFNLPIKFKLDKKSKKKARSKKS